MRIKHTPGAQYRDAWNGRTVQPQIVDGWALIELTIDTGDIGCIVTC